MSDYAIIATFADDEGDSGSLPWLVSAYDEWTEENWGGVPDFHKEAIAKSEGPGVAIRTTKIFVTEEDVCKLFEPNQRLEGRMISR